MNKNEAQKQACVPLKVAVTLLEREHRAITLRERVQAIERQLNPNPNPEDGAYYRGDIQDAVGKLDDIVHELKELNRIPQATEPPGVKMMQGSKAELSPNVAKVIDCINKALKVLRPFLDRKKKID